MNQKRALLIFISLFLASILASVIVIAADGDTPPTSTEVTSYAAIQLLTHQCDTSGGSGVNPEHIEDCHNNEKVALNRYCLESSVANPEEDSAENCGGYEGDENQCSNNGQFKVYPEDAQDGCIFYSIEV